MSHLYRRFQAEVKPILTWKIALFSICIARPDKEIIAGFCIRILSECSGKETESHVTPLISSTRKSFALWSSGMILEIAEYSAKPWSAGSRVPCTGKLTAIVFVTAEIFNLFFVVSAIS